MKRRWLILSLVVLVVSGLHPVRVAARDSREAQDDPVAQCAQGVQLFLDGRAMEANPLLEAGFAARDAAEFANPDDLGMCALVLGLVRDSIGNSAGALSAYTVALEVFRASGDRSLEDTALNNIGFIYSNQGRYPEAMEAYQQALDIERAVDDREGEGITLSNMGGVHDAQGRYDDALLVYKQALAIAQEVGDRVGEGTTLNNIGAVYRSQGRYAEALETLQQALLIRQEVNDRTGVGRSFDNIGGVYGEQGRYDKALEALTQALAIAREVSDRSAEGVALNNIGAIYYAQKRYDEALEAHKQALAIRREVGDSLGEAATLANLGSVYRDQERYTEALRSLEQALAIMRDVGDQTGEGAALNAIGAVFDKQGHYPDALATFEQALAIRRKVGDRTGEGVTLDNIGLVYYNQHRYTEALAKYHEAMAVFESLRAIAGSEAARAGFIAQYADLYDRAIELYHDQGQDAAAFFTSERGRGRSFLDSLGTGSVELSDNASADLFATEQETYATRKSVQDALARARALSPADPALVADIEAQLAAAEQEHQAALDAITARGGQLAALVPGRSSVLDLAAVQRLLDDQTTLVSYWVLGDQGTLAFVVTGDSLTTVELPDATPANLNKALADLRQWSNPANPHPLPLRNLNGWLAAPLAEHLQTSHVVIVPHQQLHYVPFAALSDGQSYFGQQHLLSVIPSASALPYIQENAAVSAGTADTHDLIFGNPSTDNPALKPLTHAASEAEAIASLLGTVAVTDAEASESRLRDEAAGSRVIHLAAHGGYNVANPLYSAIYLAPGGEGTADDGQLETHEIYGLELKGNELVVLSACQTNVGELSVGDELVGMTRAFFFAGTPTILSSLWSVDDEATETLMTAFYRHWQAGMGKAEALQAAQAEVRVNPQWASPFYWAAFVLNGDPGTISRSPAAGPVSQSNRAPSPSAPASQSSGGSPCGMVIGMMVVGLTVIVSRRRR